MPESQHNTSPSVSTTRTTCLCKQATMDRCSQLQPKSSEGKDSCEAIDKAKKKSKGGGAAEWIILSEPSDAAESSGSMDEYAEDLSQDIRNASDRRDHLHKLELLE